MATRLVARVGFEWITERPFWDAPRRSEYFSLLGSDYYLSLRLDGKNYRIYLCGSGTFLQPEDTGTLTFVLDQSTGSVIGSRVGCSEGGKDGHLIWFHTRKGLTEECRVMWRVVFIMGQMPLTFQTLNERVSLSAIPRALPPVQNASPLSSDFEIMSSDFSNILEHKTYSDVKLICGDRTFPVHKVILSARSEVFAAMFRNPMAESETGVIRVDDLDATLLELFLRYVYSGKMSDLSEDTASQLYVVGDKYAVVSLRKACSDWMRDNLTTDNCLHFLVLADRHGDDTFKSSVVQYAAANLQLLDKGAWAQFSTEHPTLAVCVYHKHVFEISQEEHSAK